MTVRQIVEWLEAFNVAKIEKAKEQAVFMQGQAQQIISGICRLFDSKTKFVGLDKLYPEWFGKRQQTDLSHMTPEQIQKIEAKTWSIFLGVK